MCVGVRGGGLDGYVFCCDNSYYGFSFGLLIIHMSVGYYQFKCCALTCFDVFTLYVYIFNETWYLAELFRED